MSSSSPSWICRSISVWVRGDADGPGVRDAHGNAVEAHRQADAQPLHDLPHGRGEALPLHVRLGTGQEQEGRAGGVLHEPHLDGGFLVVRPGVPLEGQQRPTGPVVHEPVVVEAGDDLVGQRVEHLVDDLVAGLPGVDVSVEVVQHDQSGRLLGECHVDDGKALRLPGVQILRIKHGDRSPPRVRTSQHPCGVGHSRETH